MSRSLEPANPRAISDGRDPVPLDDEAAAGVFGARSIDDGGADLDYVSVPHADPVLPAAILTASRIFS